MRRSASAIAWIAVASVVGGAAAAPSLRIAGQIGGPALATAVAGNLAFAGAGYRLVIYDLANAASPREVGSLAFNDTVRRIVVNGTRAYVAAGASGFHIVDVSNSSQPALIGAWDSPGCAEGLAIRGSLVYIADGPFGLQIVDVSDPQNPKWVASAFDDYFAFDVALGADRAFIAGADAGVLLADISDPRRPIETSIIDTPGYARAVEVLGNRAVIADAWEGIRIIDGSDLHSPRELGSITLRSWAMDVAIAQSTAFVATGSEGLIAVDVSDGANPRQVANVAFTAGDALAVAVDSGRATVAAGRAGLQVIDASNVASPRLLSAITPLAAALLVASAPPYVYVTGAPWLTIVDASNPQSPRQVAVVPSVGTTTTNHVVANQSVIYVSTSAGYFIVYDIGNASQPVEIGRVTMPEMTNFYATVMRGKSWIAAAENSFVIFDVSDSRKPVIRSSIRMVAQGLAVVGDFAFVGEGDSGIAVIDLSDQASPKVVTRYQPAGCRPIGPLAAADHYLYSLNCNRIDIIDVANAAAPTSVASFPLSGCCGVSVASAGDRLYVISSTEGVVELDISNRTSPNVISTTPLPGTLFGLSVAEGIVAVGARLSGLFLLDTRMQLQNVASRVTDPAAPHESPEIRVVASASPAPIHFRPLRAAPAARQVTVTSTSDSGTGSFRQALNGSAAGDVITFDLSRFPPGNPAVIRPQSQLPCLRNVTVDASNAGVVIDGGDITAFANGIEMCGGAVVMGLQVINFTGSGFSLQEGTDNAIGGNALRGSGPFGEGNLVSGNKFAGIDSTIRSTRNRITGNVLGLAPAGRTLRYAQPNGFFCQSSDNVIGGTSPGERNLISGNAAGVGLAQQTCTHNLVVGNYIGTDSTGTTIVPYQAGSSSRSGVGITGGRDNLVIDNIIAAGSGVLMSDPGTSFNRIVRNRVGVGPNGERISGTYFNIRNGIGTGQSYNLIAENIIAGFPGTGIMVSASDNIIVRNRVGLNVDGSAAMPNSGPGIDLGSVQHAFIGGRSFAEANVVSGNDGPGIRLTGRSGAQNFILGNIVGLSRFETAIGNRGAGIEISAAQQNFIQRNTISGNGSGISVNARNPLRRNSIYANVGAGISSVAGVAVPRITEVTSTAVAGQACAGCRVEVFSDSGDEGQWFEGETVADAAGRFTMSKAGGIVRGPRVSATATDAAGATSAFSESRATPPPPPRRRAVVH